MIYLRNLLPKDANVMLKWMHNEKIIYHLPTHFEKFTLEDCESFIVKCGKKGENLHFAIVDSDDKYKGTISLKHINLLNNNAEFAVILAEDAIGTGIIYRAMDLMLEKAFQELKLDKVYLYVFEENIRANRAYIKYGWTKEGCFRKHIKDRFGNLKNVNWYSILREEANDLTTQNVV